MGSYDKFKIKMKSTNYYFVSVGVDSSDIKSNLYKMDLRELIRSTIISEIEELAFEDIINIEIRFTKPTQNIENKFDSNQIQNIQEYYIQINDNIKISSDEIENIIVECLINSNINVEGSKSDIKTSVKIGK
jgi:hypothetical protein